MILETHRCVCVRPILLECPFCDVYMQRIIYNAEGLRKDTAPE